MDRLQRQIGKLRDNFSIVLYEIKGYEFDHDINKENYEFEHKIQRYVLIRKI